MSYSDIFKELLKEHDGKNSFEQFVIELFAQAKKKDEINGINQMFIEILRSYSYTSENLDTMIQYGADIMHNDGISFFYMLLYGHLSIFIHCVDKYHCDVNFFRKHINFSISDEAFGVLIDRGLNLDDKMLLKKFFYWGSIKKATMLITNGVSIHDLLDLYLDDCSNTKYTDTFPTFVIRKIISDNNMDEICSENINKLLLNAIYYLSTSEIRQIFSMGINPRYANDIYLDKICINIDAHEFSGFIDDYGWDIHADERDLLFAAITGDNFGLAKLFLDRGIKISRGVIIASLRDEKYLNLLVEHDIDIQYYSKFFVDTMTKDEKQKFGIFKIFIKNGVNMNQLIMDCNNNE